MDWNGDILWSRSFTHREIYKMVREQQIMIEAWSVLYLLM